MHIEIKDDLCHVWFKNTRDEQQNEEILLVFGDKESYYDEFKNLIRTLVYSNKRTDTLKNKEACIDEYSFKTPWCNIYIINKESARKSFKDIKENKDKNIILFVDEIYEDFFYDLKTLNYPNTGGKALNYLYTDLNKENMDAYSNIIKNIDNTEMPTTNFFYSLKNYSYCYYIKEFPEIMDSLQDLYFPRIEKFLFYNIIDNTPTSSNIKYLINGTAYTQTENSKHHYTDEVDPIILITADFNLLQDYLILTSRLAIILYRLATLDFKANPTQVGIFYRDTLKFKSETINLKNSLFMKLPPYIKKTFRGYNLATKPKTEDEIRVEIAKKLFKYKVDEKIIFKATKVSKELLLKY